MRKNAYRLKFLKGDYNDSTISLLTCKFSKDVLENLN